MLFQFFGFLLCFNFISTISIVKNIPDSSVDELPIVYYVNAQLTALTTEIDWVSFTQCQNSTANLPFIQISIIQPENPTFNTLKAFTVIEVSQCANSFEVECIVGVNYYEQNHVFYANNNITIPYNVSATKLYIRYTSYIGTSPFTLHVTYVEGPSVNGTYDDSIFGTNSVPLTTPGTFGQYVHLDRIDTVQNSDFHYYFISFCAADMPSNQNYYTTVTVASDLQTPLAAFNLVACSVALFGDSSDCTFINKNKQGVVAIQSAASVTSVTMYSAQINLKQGFWVGVFGYGGEPLMDNDYQICIEEYPTN